MTHSVVWLEQADADLDSIYRWIADGGTREAALRFVLRIEAAGEKLADFPNRGRPRDDLVPGLRSISCARAVTIFYTVGAGEVHILRVIRARRDTAAVFADE